MKLAALFAAGVFAAGVLPNASQAQTRVAVDLRIGSAPYGYGYHDWGYRPYYSRPYFGPRGCAVRGYGWVGDCRGAQIVVVPRYSPPARKYYRSNHYRDNRYRDHHDRGRNWR